MEIYAGNNSVYRICKMRRILRREDIDINRKYNAHLMPRVGVVSKDKYRFSKTTCNPRGPDTGLGLVGCVSQTPEPYRVWGADINSVRSRGGCVYKIFVTCVFYKHNIGWALSDSMRTSSIAAADV